MKKHINLFASKKIRLVVLISLAILSFSFLQTNDPFKKIMSGFARYAEIFPTEKVYLHLDRPYYTTGETIWLKAYLTAGANHEPSPISNTIYVELINDKKQIVKKLKFLSINGSSAGSITIDNSLESGSYLIRSYTNWMKNGGEDYFFHRPIKIWNIENVKNSIAKVKGLDVQFFPEGGDLVNGVPSKVAIKAVGADGLGRSVKGKIVEGNTIITEFESNSLGMGVFYLKPRKDQIYKAIVENYEEKIILPKAKESGLTLSVINSSESTKIIANIQNTNNSELKSINILAQTRGIIHYSARSDLSSNAAIAEIPKENIPSGITQITVTDHNGVPLAERLIFVDQKDQVNFNITANKSTYAPRELVNLDIQATDASGKPIVADLSLSVFDNQQVFMDENSEDIYSYLLLSSELTGHIESPGYYFNPDNKDREEALDHLLLTQGWRRLTIKDASEQKWESPQYKAEQGLTVKGKMIDELNSKPIIDGKVLYISNYPIHETRTVYTNSKGEFEISNVLFFDSTNVMLQGETKRGRKSVKIIVYKIKDSTSDELPLLTNNIEALNEFEKAFIAKSIERKTIDEAYEFGEKTITLEGLEIRSTRSDFQNIGSRIYGKGSATIKVSDFPFLENLQHPMQLVEGRVAGVQVVGSGMEWSVSMRGPSSMKSGTTPLILVDDMPVPFSFLGSIPVQEIESFTVWKGPTSAIFGVRGANGVIGFYTKKGDQAFTSSKNGSITHAGIGYHVEREFYAPKYDVKKPEHIKPDRRVTLFWQPFIQTDSTGKASVSFYNHDVETTIRGTLEGISATGSAGSINFDYEIRENN
ncbi:MAG: TonB-dependent receptor plug domain-containing protein [Cyclobacteriaceae bacterium]|nr:TonB-dependent receptor plug domain-containing protein [Cyclobacteriaceae bacterium]MCH8515101.1 TonB-dependent receptor plug domain-containing protein [Cyclobacteriaceae bacterium]